MQLPSSNLSKESLLEKMYVMAPFFRNHWASLEASVTINGVCKAAAGNRLISGIISVFT